MESNPYRAPQSDTFVSPAVSTEPSSGSVIRGSLRHSFRLGVIVGLCALGTYWILIVIFRELDRWADGFFVAAGACVAFLLVYAPAVVFSDLLAHRQRQDLS